MAGYDFTLVVGVDENLSFAEFQKGIQNVINRINGESHKVKIGIETGDADKHVENLHSQLTELSSQASKINGFDSMVSTVNQLQEQISALSKAIQGFQGISLNISTGSKNPVKQMAEYGQAARTTIEDLKRQANEMSRVFLNMFGGNNGVQAVALQANKLKGIFDLPGKSQGEREYGKYGEMLPFISKVTNALGDVGNLQERMQTLREYIALIQEVAQARGIKLPSTITAQDADAAIQEVNKIRDGTKEAEAEMDKLKSLFGSGINAEALKSQIEPIIGKLQELITVVGEVKTAIANMVPPTGATNAAAVEEVTAKTREEAEATSELEANVRQIKETTESHLGVIKEQIAAQEREAEAQKKASAAARQAAETRKANADALQFGKQVIDEYYSALVKLEKVGDGHITRDENGNYVTDDAAKYGQLTAELNRCSQAYATLMKVNSEEASTSRTSADIRAYDTQKARENAIAIEELQRKRADASGKQEQQELDRATRAWDNYTQAMRRAYNMLKNSSAASKSSKPGAQDTYNNLRKVVAASDAVGKSYQKQEASVKDLEDQTKQLNTVTRESGRYFEENGLKTKTFSERIGGLAQKFSAWLSVSQVIMYAIRTVRKMITEVKEIDAAMGQLRIVTDANSEAMTRFGNNMAATAAKIGASMKDLIDSATTYARLGYSLEESGVLAEYTSMLKNVGDIEVSDAQDAVTAITKAFDIDVGQIKNKMDELVKVGNSFPISTAQLAEGLNNAASSLAAAGNTFEQSVALLTAANTTVNLCRAA